MSKKLTIKMMQECAQKKRGKCLSSVYVNNQTKLKWQCEEGHTWLAVPTSVYNNNTWCRECRNKANKNRCANQYGNFHNKKKEEEKLKNIIVKYHPRGKLLSPYVNSQEKVKVKCNIKGHKPFWMKPSHIKDRHWCSECYGNKKSNIDEIKRIVKEKGGTCLTKKYINNRNMIKVRCEEGHVFSTCAHEIKADRWCPKCHGGVSERTCKSYFENMFKEEFPKIKPNWLVNSKSNRMELDGFCKKLNIAFEYQGKQHYNKHKFFHLKRNFEHQKDDDILKRKLCEENGVILIEIPYTIERDNMQEYIQERCKEKGLLIKDMGKISPNLLDVNSPKRLESMKKLAESKGYALLSKVYINNSTKLKFKHIKCNYVWQVTPANFKNGQKCPRCQGKIVTIQDLKDYATKHEGKLLSTEYQGANNKSQWQCKQGHSFFRSYSNMKYYSAWCPICAEKKKGSSQKLSLEIIQKYAKAKGGECISKDYINSHKKLKWKCKNGHIWERSYSDMKHRGNWCPNCRT